MAHLHLLFGRFLQELLKGMDAHKSEVLSINLRSADFLQSEPDSEEAWELREGLKEMNTSWDRLGASLEDWREELQGVLMQCQVLKPTYTWFLAAFFDLQNSISLQLFIFYILMQEFHEMSHGLLLWLENIDRRRNEVVPIAPEVERETLRAYHRTLTVCRVSVCVVSPILLIHDLMIKFLLC